MDFSNTDQKEVAVPPSTAETRPGREVAPKLNATTRAAAILAKKKQRRAAHRVTLRRSHTKG